MKQIKLGGSGKYAIVDDEDYNHLQGMGRWYADKSLHTDYVRSYKKGNPKMHRIIMKAPRGKIVDHINGNGLDNRKQNLRFVTSQQNCMNQGPRTGKYKGVWYEERPRRKSHWKASITIDYKRIHLGYFLTDVEAAAAYNQAALELVGEYARLNDI